MLDPAENYWGTVLPAEDSAPVALLKRQAEILTEITRGKIKGVVQEYVEGETLFASLYAGVPAMGDYQYRILSIGHPVGADPTSPSPIWIFSHPRGQLTGFSDDPGLQLDGTMDIGEPFKTVREFEDYLKEFLSSKPIRAAIGNLLKYSGGMSTSRVDG